MTAKKCILVVEDDRQLRDALIIVFGKHDYEVLSAADGEAGLELAKTKLPDLIILDLLMPKMNGREMLKLLREDSRAKHIPAVVLTNDDSPESIKQASASGAPAYFSKASTSLKELLDIVSYHLNS
jgi:two-component system sensor histidine kinase/response regulator